MQPTPTGSTNTGFGDGGAELSRPPGGVGGGLARFRSAPATWLEALLEEDEEDPLKPTQCLTQLLTANSTTPTLRNSPISSDDLALFHAGGSVASGGSGFLRQHSSPAEFLSSAASAPDGFFSNLNVPMSFDYLSPSSSPVAADVSVIGKRAREAELHRSSSAKISTQLKGEQSSQLHSGMANILDAEMERLLEDSVPCRVRAKRGCATHPRSIAERVRRTRISDRIRKLQELVPNMDKQTNTADMLEEAVEYVKLLQKQIQELTEHQSKCKCTVRE